MTTGGPTTGGTVTSGTTTSTTHDTSPADAPSKPAAAGNTGNNTQEAQAAEAVDRVHSPKQGADPALVGDSNPEIKLTGTGAPGSHSAYFGLTPSGKKVEETSSATSAPKPAHSKETAVGGGQESSEGDTGSRAPAGNAEVSEQMNKVGTGPGQTGAQSKDPAPLSGASDEKPGAGATGLTQGSGDVRPGE